MTELAAPCPPWASLSSLLALVQGKRPCQRCGRLPPGSPSSPTPSSHWEPAKCFFTFSRLCKSLLNLTDLQALSSEATLAGSVLKPVSLQLSGPISLSLVLPGSHGLRIREACGGPRLQGSALTIPPVPRAGHQTGSHFQNLCLLFRGLWCQTLSQAGHLRRASWRR